MFFSNSIVNNFACLWDYLSFKRRLQFIFFIFFVIFVSFFEILNIGAIFPFLAVLASPEKVFVNPIFTPAIVFFKFSDPSQLVLPFTIFFGLTAFMAGVMRILLVWTISQLSFSLGKDISLDIYRRTLFQPYLVHCSRNSNEVISGVIHKVDSSIYHSIMPAITLLSSTVILFAILFVLININSIISLYIFLIFGFLYLFISFLTKNILSSNSENISSGSETVVKLLQEGLGGIRDILIGNNQNTYCEIYSKVDISLRRSQAINLFINNSPRYFIESFGMIIIALIAYNLTIGKEGFSNAMPMLGVMALGAQRLMPILQQLYSSWASIKGNELAFKGALVLLNQPIDNVRSKSKVKRILFRKSFSLNNVSFKYPANPNYAIKNFTFKIKKGERIGVIGASGSGKSTLIDLMMGLLIPNEGYLKLDEKIISKRNIRSWQEHIAHVPQAIFLSDASVAENIAFGVNKKEINLKKVAIAAKKAQISELIESWKEGYNTFVGERGIRLSGGQRQRIGIARALYKQADMIVFDEATSALDSETEGAVMQAIENLSRDLTIVIIAHRISTLKNCSKIIELSDGNINRVGSYQNILNKKINLKQKK